MLYTTSSWESLQNPLNYMVDSGIVRKRNIFHDLLQIQYTLLVSTSRLWWAKDPSGAMMGRRRTNKKKNF